MVSFFLLILFAAFVNCDQIEHVVACYQIGNPKLICMLVIFYAFSCLLFSMLVDLYCRFVVVDACYLVCSMLVVVVIL